MPNDTRWGFFPGVSVGWRLSNEPFIKENLNFIDNLKLRASTGKTGNDRIGDFLYERTMSMSVDPVVILGEELQHQLVVNNVPNRNIKWETTHSTNVGFDAMLWRGLFGIEFDFFYSRTTDILGGIASKAPSLGGYFPSVINYGKVDNRGFELVLTHQNRVSDFTYNVRGNLSWARNKILKYNEDANVPNQFLATGKPMGLKYGFVADGFYQSEEEILNSPKYTGVTWPGDIKLKDLNGDGRITREQDRTIVGRSNIPEMMFGLNLGAEYKGFDLNVFFQGAALCDVALCGVYSDRGGIEDNTFYTQPFYSDGNAPYYLVEKAWRPDNPNAEYPRLSTFARDNGGKSSSFWIKNGAYLRLKNMQFGYTIPQTLTRKIKLEKARFYFSGSTYLHWII